jgi:hypothetical protein
MAAVDDVDEVIEQYQLALDDDEGRIGLGGNHTNLETWPGAV